MTPTSRQTQAPAEAEAAKEEFIEYAGRPPYGVELEDRRIITRKDAKEAWDFTLAKDLVWTKNGRGRMLLPASEIPSEIRELLLEDPSFKVVTK